LHEFLPQTDDDLSALESLLGVDAAALRARITALHETNPMLGHRGCRLAITAPEIYEMQLRAIFGALQDIANEAGETPQVEIMFPLVIDVAELEILNRMTQRIAEQYEAAHSFAPAYVTGSMIEVPRAAVLADRLAAQAAFFSFGTNDLTQTGLGLSRDDSGNFLPDYVKNHIFENDPFATLDRDGVGALMELAAGKARATRPDVKLGICGEHGGDPATIEFCQQLGLDYVSCSPFRVPIARLAAAQAAIRRKQGAK
jgi:pyruvate,orthophosphate dikinase